MRPTNVLPPPPRFVALQWFAVLATALFVAGAGVTRPLHNWDMINYVASAYTSDGLAGRELSDRVYADVLAEVGPDMFATLVQGDYRATVHRDPEALRQQLPIARIRVAYVALMRLLHRAGVTYPRATYLISAAAAGASVVLLGLICRNLRLSPLVVPLAVAWCGYIRLARLSTPDALMCLAALVAMWLFLMRHWAAYAAAAVLPLIRTDFVLLSVLLAVYGCLDGKRTWALASAVCATGLYLGLNSALGGYGWLTLLNATFITGAHPYPETMPVAGRVEPYLQAYLRGLWAFLGHHHVVIYGGAILLVAERTGRQAMPREQLAALGILAAFVASHFLLFPVYGERFFSSAASVVLLVGLAQAGRIWESSRA